MKPSETAELLGILRVFWPNAGADDLSAETAVKAWHMVIGDQDYDDMQLAVRAYMRSGKPFHPQPSDLIRLIADAKVGPLVPEAAWGEVRKEISRHPYGVKNIFDPVTQKSIPNPGPSFSHPLIAEAVEATGWELICRCDDEAKVKEQFTWTLKRLQEREVREQATKPGRLVELADGARAMIGAGT